jgi:hypothetical protein
VANITENVTTVITTAVTKSPRKETIGDALNPINMLQKGSVYIQSNRILFVLLICMIALIAAWLAYMIWEEWKSIPPREKSIRVGKTNVLQVFAEELKKRLKQKKKFG